MRSLDLAIGRCLASFMALSVILPLVAVAQAQDSDEGGEDLLILSTDMCGAKYIDRLSLANCLARQNAKADRWMKAILESYARILASDMTDVAEGGGVPTDTVALLHKSQVAFEAYRNEAAEVAGRYRDGRRVRIIDDEFYVDD